MNLLKPKELPLCNRLDCFGNGRLFDREGVSGRCKILTDTNFKQGGVEVCPFYKKREEKTK